MQPYNAQQSTAQAGETSCERCDRESQHLIKFIGPDNQTHYVCWNCRGRQEKRINLRETWRRGKRAH